MSSNIKEIVGRGDLRWTGTASRCEGGLPIGNGITGTLVWTSPSALKIGVNRNDVYANNSFSTSFNERHMDYGYACGFVDIDFADFGFDVFTERTRQHLDLYKAEGTIDGEGIKSRFFACEGMDVLAFRLEDSREQPETVSVRLKMLRGPEHQVKNNLARSRFEVLDDVIVLVQEFTEGDYYCSSALAVKAAGRHCRVRPSGDREMRLCLEGGRGVFEVFAASAATFDRNEDIVRKAAGLANQAAAAGYDALKAEQARVWEKYWDVSHVELWGDEDAAVIEQHYQYYMYIIGCCSRNGQYAPNFGGLLFAPRGDLRHWGTMQWGANLSLYYYPVMASGHYELMEPFFQSWINMMDRCAVAARQQWDSKGLYIPEVVGFDGPEVLPEDIGKELCDLMLVRKQWSERSDKFWEFAFNKRPHESRWNFKTYEAWSHGKQIIKDRGIGAFGPVTHMFNFQTFISFMFWEYYQYTGDLRHLREKGWPIIKGVAEFFANFPNLKKDEDGKYHAYFTNCGEGFFGSKDSMETMAAIYGALSVAIKVSELLDEDAALRESWQEIYDHLAPLPSSDNKDFRDQIETDRPVWVNAVGTYATLHKYPVGTTITPIRVSDMCTLETQEANPEMYAMGKASFEWMMNHGGNFTQRVGEMSGMGRICCLMGHGDEMRQLLHNQINCINSSREYCYYEFNGFAPQFENRLTSREGTNAMSAQRLGNVASAVQTGLIQSSGGTTTADPVIRLFPALPTGWNARFRLHAKGGFQVDAQCVDGKPGSAVIVSQLGTRLKLRNCWNSDVTVKVNGSAVMTTGDSLICLDTVKGDVIEVSRA